MTEKTQQNVPSSPAPIPTDNKVQMVAPTGKKVRIRALQNLNFATPSNPNGIQLSPGQEAEVDEALAKDLARPIEGTFNFGGELVAEQATRHKHIRAEIVG